MQLQRPEVSVRRDMGEWLLFFYGYMALHWLTGVAMFHHKLSFSYAGVVRYYVGDPEQFIPPRSFIGLLEVSHFHLFAMGLFFVVFAHLLQLSRYPAPLKRILNRSLALTLVLDMAAGWLIRYVAEPFAWLKLGAFFTLQLLCVVLLAALVVDLVRPRRSGAG